MSRKSPGHDEHFQREVQRARRLFFLLLPVAVISILASWALSAGILSGDEIAAAAGNTISSVAGFFGGGK